MIPEHARRLLTNEGYDAQYCEMMCYYDTCEKAWEAVERQYYNYFGKNRFSSYSSYNAARWRKRQNVT